MSSPDNPLTGTPLSPLDVSYSALVATLVLLLAVSSAIVIRSLILRRRHQRLVEEAIRTGTWLPHNYDSPSGRRRRDIGQKPKLWEARLHHNDDDGDGEVNEKSKWMDITVGLIPCGTTHPSLNPSLLFHLSSPSMPHTSISPRHHHEDPQVPRRMPSTLHHAPRGSCDLLRGQDHRHHHSPRLPRRWLVKYHLYPLHLRQHPQCMSQFSSQCRVHHINTLAMRAGHP